VKSKINFYLLEYALSSLLRQKSKTFLISFIFTFLIFLVLSVLFISNSIKAELKTTVEKLPHITVQQIKGGRIVAIDSFISEDISSITGVNSAIPRVWGYYYFENAGVNFSIVGIDPFDKQYTKSLNTLIKDETNIQKLENDQMIVGEGVKRILEQNYFKNYFNFILDNGEFKKVKIAGVFKSDIELQSNDMIIVSKTLAHTLLSLDEEIATDIVVDVANIDEIATIVGKIKAINPNLKVITSEDYKISYDNIFDYKSGLFLSLFIISLFTFFILVYDKASGLTSMEKKEIGILKALGWSIDDILKEKFIESFIISFSSFILAIVLSLFFVYILDAPILRYIFEGYSQLKTSFDLPFVLDIQTLALVFFITIPVYIAATIIPSWKIATLDADEVIR
jgi:ABC-type lipoprotein release transport system permease subunit